MTPQQIIDRVTSRYDVLYYSDAEKLQSLMSDTLGKFEDRAGAVRSFQIQSPETNGVKPSDFLAVATVHDADGRFVEHDASGSSSVSIFGNPSYPVTVKYLVNFRAIGMDDELPPVSVGLISEHFDAMLALLNTRRERNVVSAAGLQRELVAEESLRARVEAVELAMEENAEILPIATVT